CSWAEPDARVILYSLYKFAEKCGGYYQFSLSTLLDDSIERDGISPTRIFGLNHDTMVTILNGLSVNDPYFISASLRTNHVESEPSYRGSGQKFWILLDYVKANPLRMC